MILGFQRTSWPPYMTYSIQSRAQNTYIMLISYYNHWSETLKSSYVSGYATREGLSLFILTNNMRHQIRQLNMATRTDLALWQIMHYNWSVTCIHQLINYYPTHLGDGVITPSLVEYLHFATQIMSRSMPSQLHPISCTVWPPHMSSLHCQKHEYCCWPF